MLDKLVLALALQACAATTNVSGGVAMPGGDEVVEIGGELEGPPAATLLVDDTMITAWGVVEVPGESRLQAALAMADAATRAELMKALVVTITSLEKDRASATAQDITLVSAEIAGTLLPSLPLPEHGYRRLRRDAGTVLQVYARLRAPRAALTQALAQALAARGHDAASASQIVDRLSR